MKKCYKFIIDKWTCPNCASDYRATIRSWIKDFGTNGKAKLYIRDDAYVYATDKDVVHLVLEDYDYWKNLPAVLNNYGSDILDVIMDHITNFMDGDNIDLEEELLDYLTD